MFCSSIQAFCRKGLLCFLLISETITGGQHLFSMLVTSWLQLMTHHRVRARLVFFRYCSLHPCGTTRIPNKIGIIWFLNLAFSYQKDQNPIAGNVSMPNQMKWHSPFGRTFFGDMKGTKKFPALRLLDIGVLPLQDDAHSCGIVLIAAIGIIL
jgi:hypothetical protein